MEPIYSVVIGTELLDGRRALSKRGHSLAGHFVIPDLPERMEKVFRLIKDENAYMFCFGGIGATPDDYTRAVAAKVFTNKPVQPHPQAISLIKSQFGQEATPIRLRMGEFPEGARLLDNPINQVPGFVINRRCYFTPGFPAMAQPMVLQAIEEYLPINSTEVFIWRAIIYGRESILVPLMEALPDDLSLSSLPHMADEGTHHVEIEIKGTSRQLLKQGVDEFCIGLKNLALRYTLVGYHDENFQ